MLFLLKNLKCPGFGGWCISGGNCSHSLQQPIQRYTLYIIKFSIEGLNKDGLLSDTFNHIIGCFCNFVDIQSVHFWLHVTLGLNLFQIELAVGFIVCVTEI